MNRRMTRQFLLSLVVGLGMALSPAISWGAPLVYIQLLARPDGTTQAFSSTITPTAVGEEFDWIVVATLAPAGTKNTNLPVDGNGNQTIGSWQYNQDTGVSDGLGAAVYALYESPSATTAQVSFQRAGFLGATATGSHPGIDPSISNGLVTNQNTSGNTYGNAGYSGGVGTSTYTYPSNTGTQTPTGISQSPTGSALWQNFAQGSGITGGTVSQRNGTTNDLTNVVAIVGSNVYTGVDDGTVDTSGLNQSPVTMILESGSKNYYDTVMNSATKGDSTFVVTSLGASSTLNVNAFDMNPGNPGGVLSSTADFLNLQYHDTTGAMVKPGTSGSLQYSVQASDPVVQYTGLTIVGSVVTANTSVLAFNPTTLPFGRVLKNSTPTLNATLTNTPTNGTDTANFTGVTSNNGIVGPASGGPVPGGSPGTLPVSIQLQNNTNGTGTVGTNSWTYSVTNTSNTGDTSATGKTLTVSADVVAPRVLTPNPVTITGGIVGAGTINIPFSFTSTGDLATTTSVIVNSGGGSISGVGGAGASGFTTSGSYTFNGGQATIGNVTFNAGTDTYTGSGTITGSLTSGQVVSGSVTLPVTTLETGLGDTYASIVVNFTATSTPAGSNSILPAVANGSNSPTTFGTTVSEAIGNGGTFVGAGSNVTGENGTAGAFVEMTTAQILAGTNTTGGTVTATFAWRTRNLNEVKPSQGQNGSVGSPTRPPLGPFTLTLISDVVNLTLAGEPMSGATDPYALEMNFGTSTLHGGPAEITALVNNGFLYLAWLNPTGSPMGTPQWVNAVTGNTGNNATAAEQGYIGTFAAFQGVNGTNLANYMGAWGVDPNGDEAWAVLNHDAVFAVVPEPTTLALAGCGLLGLLGVARRRKLASAISR